MRKKEEANTWCLVIDKENIKGKKKAADKVQWEGFFCQLIFMSFPLHLVG